MPGASAGERWTGALADARAMYLVYYMALGAFVPFVNLYYERMGMTGVQIGALAALPVLVSSSTSLLWGGIADAFRLHRRILNVALLVAPMAVLMLSRATHYGAMVPWVIAYALFTSPIVPLLDSAALELGEARKLSYGGLRMWGTVGWSVSTLVVGALIREWDIRWLFYSHIALLAAAFVMSLFQPARRHVLRSPLGRGLRSLLGQRIFLLFLSGVFFLSVASGAANCFLSLYLESIGADERTIGLAWTLAAVSEIPVMLGSGFIMGRVGAGGLLKLAFLAFALRWLLLSFVTTPAWALVLQLMNGPAYGAFVVGGVTYTNQCAPEGLSTTAQAIFNTVSLGLASIAGSLAGGYFFDTVGMTALFRALSLTTGVGLIIFWLAGTPARVRVATQSTPAGSR